MEDLYNQWMSPSAHESDELKFRNPGSQCRSNYCISQNAWIAGHEDGSGSSFGRVPCEVARRAQSLSEYTF